MENFQPEFHQCLFYEEYKRQAVQANDIQNSVQKYIYEQCILY